MESNHTTQEHGVGTKISRERAQDWISSVLNPIIDGLEVEQRHLDAHLWVWEPIAKRFEYLRSISDNVSEFYRDNLEDFLDQYPHFKDQFDEHDQLLPRLASIAVTGYELLRNHPDGESFRLLFQQAAENVRLDIPEHALDYFCAQVASGFQTLPDNYANAQLFNERIRPWIEQLKGGKLADALRDGSNLAMQLKETATRLRDGLKACRKEIANRYGARIRPVEW